MFSKLKINTKLLKELDFTLLISILIITLFGILNIYLCTKALEPNNPLIYTKKQLTWFLISIILFYFMLTFDYKILYKYVPLLYWVSIILLISVWIPGIGVKVNGARGWINLRVCLLQPAEIAKFTMILMLSKLLEDFDGEINNFKNFCIFLFYTALPMLLIVIQKDMGMTMVCFFIALGIVFIAKLNIRVILYGLLTIVVSITLIWNTGLIYSHQKDRIEEFLNPGMDTSGKGYQFSQNIIGIGSGGILGNKVSMDNSIPSGYASANVPEIQTDFIFSAIAEQWGLVGSLFLLFLYAIVILRILKISKESKDVFGSMVCVGMASYILFAIAQNVGMTLGLVPITGITLPLTSYGGSSLLTTLVSLGLVINIGMNKRKIVF